MKLSTRQDTENERRKYGFNDFRYRPQLDGLRAIAVSGVLYAHFWDASSSLGHQGVRLFFVLSGFLITGILLRKTSIRTNIALGRFYARRAFRIFPAYFAVVLFGIALSDQIRKAALWLMTYTINFHFAFTGEWEPWQTAHLWSLSVEEQFYMLWAPLVLFLPSRNLMGVAVTSCFVAPAFRLLVWHFQPDDVAQYVLLPGSLDALGIGAVLALLRSRTAPISLGDWPLFFIASAAFLAQTILTQADLPGWLYVGPVETLSLISLTALVILADRGTFSLVSPVLENPLALYVGKISYGVYLYHPFVVWVYLQVVKRLGDPGYLPTERGLPLFVVCGLGTIACAAISWRVFEAPINRMKRHFPHA